METLARPRTGLIIGKFLPPHAGHLHLIDRALAEVDLTILVCSLAAEPIPGALRAEWLRELRPAARIVLVTDENPSTPEEHPDFWDIWTATIRRVLPSGPNVVFTSEEYGDELARRLGAEHRRVDVDRAVVPISGSAIRHDPWTNWDYLSECVRPYFVKRIVITGSECTGKSTLAPLLAEHFGTVWVEEFGRRFVDAKGGGVQPEDIDAIARGQIAAEDAAARQASRIMILDTDLLSTVVYGRHYFGEIPPWIDEALTGRLAHLYLLSDIDVPWQPDGLQRDRPHMRAEMQQLFRDALMAKGARWVDLRGSIEERLATAIEAVRKVSPGRDG